MKLLLCAWLLVCVGLCRGAMSENQLEEMRSSYRAWAESHQPEARKSAALAAQEYAKKFEGKALEDILSEETLRKLRTPLSQQAKWTNSEHVKISSHGTDGASSRISSPFFDAVLPGVPEDEVGAHIYDAMTDAILNITLSFNPVNIAPLLEAMLLTSLDGTGLGVPEAVFLVGQALGEFAVSQNPIPEYSYDKSIREADGSPMKYHEIVQDNWAGTLASTTVARTYYPKTREGIQKLVRVASWRGKRVRASGLKHSWNHWVWGVDNRDETADTSCYNTWEGNGDVDWFIAMVPYELSDPLYLFRADIESWRAESQELTFVEGPLDYWSDQYGKEWASVKVGAAALSLFLLEWELANGWVLPAEPMTPLFTLGGVVSTASHGSGIRHNPTADYVIALEYVDEKGQIQVVEDPDELDAVAGSYGLFGILLSITFRVERMTYAVYNAPEIIPSPFEDFIPRSPNPIPDSLQDIIDNAYYQTWYIIGVGQPDPEVPFAQQYVWENVGSAEDAVPLTNDVEVNFTNLIFFLRSTIAEISQQVYALTGTQDVLYPFNRIIELVFQNYILAFLGSGSTGPRVVSVAEAKHFARGLHGYNLRNFEINVPIRDDGAGNADYSTLQDVWWLATDLLDTYKAQGLYPSDWAIEIRLVSNSTRILNSLYGNQHGTVSINLGCSRNMPTDLWNQFRSDFAFRFLRFFSDSGLRPINFKPRYHLAKEIPVNVTGMSSADYFRETYAEQLDLFLDRYTSIVSHRGSSKLESLERFSTKFWDQVLISCDNRLRCNNRVWNRE